MKYCLILLSFFLPLFAADELVVHLSTESHLIPISFEMHGPGPYVTDLRRILEFDLNNNGVTQITQNESLAKYSVKALFENNALSLALLSANQTKKAGPVELAGRIGEDRKLVHELSDQLQKVLNGSEGVATGKIVYTVTEDNGGSLARSKWISEVWECDWDGANARQVTHARRYIVTPAYLPPQRGRRPSTIFYVAYTTGQPKIHIASIKDGTNDKAITLKGNQLMPAVSRQRDKIAFISDIGGNPDLFIQDFDPGVGAVGKPRQLYATAKGTQGCPCFSPDGKKIAFVSNKDGNPRIYVMDIPQKEKLASEMHPRLISKRCKESMCPCWSPDGTKLVYAGLCEGTRQLWIYDFQANEEEQITFGSHHKENPSWAPDSVHIVYNAGPEGKNDLYLMNLNQSEAVRITSGPGDKRFPCFEPR